MKIPSALPLPEQKPCCWSSNIWSYQDFILFSMGITRILHSTGTVLVVSFTLLGQLHLFSMCLSIMQQVYLNASAFVWSVVMILDIEVVRKIFFQFFGVTFSTLYQFEEGTVSLLTSSYFRFNSYRLEPTSSGYGHCCQSYLFSSFFSCIFVKLIRCHIVVFQNVLVYGFYWFSSFPVYVFIKQ